MTVIDAEENDDNKVLVYVKGCKKCNNSIATTWDSGCWLWRYMIDSLHNLY